ncbi:MAG: hypothetical protein ACWIPH_09100 [Ostreibacterium sp.]
MAIKELWEIKVGRKLQYYSIAMRAVNHGETDFSIKIFFWKSSRKGFKDFNCSPFLLFKQLIRK